MSRGTKGLNRAVREDNVYSPLPPGDIIRYLVLQPGQSNEPLACTIHTSHLNSMPYFEAVSYVWGAPHRHHRIKCNGRDLYITTNLSLTLRRVRSLMERRTLWVDSICIDQKNSTEKSHQVAFMGQIYARADRVLICLGPDDKNQGPGAASLIMEINEMIESTFRAIDFRSDGFPYLEEENLNRILSDARWVSVGSMLDDQWFFRGWVIQEAGLAKDALLLWDSAEINWLHLVRFCSWMATRAPQIMRVHGISMSQIHLDIYLRQHQREARTLQAAGLGSHPISTLQVLENGRNANFYDPRDRIYAFQALVDDPSHKDLGLLPDYNKPYLAVYYDMAKQYIEICKDLDLLNYIVHTAETIEHQASSWAPRWDIRRATSCIMIPSMPKLQSRDLSNSTPSLAARKRLRVRGTLLDSVVFTSSKLTINTSIDEMASLWEFLSVFGAISTYSPSLRLLAFVETLCNGRMQGDSDTWKANRAAYILLLNKTSCEDSESNQFDVTAFLEEAVGGDAEQFHLDVQVCAHNRRVFVTKRGYYGIGPPITSQGDICCILFGGKTPYIVRKTKTEQNYKLVGECWLPSKNKTVINGREVMDMMGLEQCKDWVDWDVTERDIFLV